MDGIPSLLRPKVAENGDQSVTNSSLNNNLGHLGYLDAVSNSSAHSNCLKCHEIYGLLHQHVLECHAGGNEKDSNSILNNVLMNILMLLTSASKNGNQTSGEQASFQTSMPACLGNASSNYSIVSTVTQALPKTSPQNIETQSSDNQNMAGEGLVSAVSLQKLLSSAQANHSKVFAQGGDNERRKTVVQGIPLITTNMQGQDNVPLVLTSHFQGETARQPTIIVPSAVPKVSEKSDLDVADILVNKMPIPSVNKEESSLAQLYLKQLAEGLASGRSDILQQDESVPQSNNNERDLVSSLLSGNASTGTSIHASSMPTESGSKPVVETISQILAAQKQLTGLLSLLGKRQNEPTLLPVAGLASQLVETPLNNPLFANQHQRMGTPSLLHIPLTSIIPGLTQTSQGIMPNNLIPAPQSVGDSNLYPQLANVLAKTSQGISEISGNGAVALPALALNSSAFQNTSVPVLHQTIQGALRGTGQQAVLLPSVVSGGSIASVSTATVLGSQSFLVPNRSLTQIVTQASTATAKTLFSTSHQPTVPSLAEQLFQNSNNIPKLALSTVPSIFNLGNMPGMAIVNPNQQPPNRNQSQATLRQIPILPTSSVIVSSGTNIAPSVDKIQGLISAALQNPSKGNAILSSTVSTSSGSDLGMAFGKHNMTSLSTNTKEGTGDIEDSKSTIKKLYKCNTCGTTFSVLSTLQQHEQTHLGTKIQCNYCNDIFASAAKYQEHISLHRGEENVHQCEYCNKLFTSRGELQKHLAEHTQKRPYKCKHCAKSFRDPGSLQKHERIHTGERPYKCQHCLKAFAEYSSLRKHNRVHTGEQPYKCPRCPKAFSISGNLQRHMFIHTGERPYRCTKCPKAFNNPSHLRRHVKNLHDVKQPSNAKDTDSNEGSDSEMIDNDFCTMAKS